MSVQEANNIIIKTDNLTKIYSYYKKDAGLGGSIKNLFHREICYKTAVSEMNIQIDTGDIIGLIGLNGAGKSTTLKLFSGLLKPTSGDIKIMGYDPFDKKENFLKQISMVMGNKSQLWWDLPAIESFELIKKIYEINDNTYKDNLEEMAELLGIKELMNTQVRRLSLGERMKMELVAALIYNPAIIFLDEPTIGLDVISQYNIRNFLKDYNNRHQSTIILTSHNFSDIISLCDKLLILNEGKIIYNDSFYNFSKQFSEEKVITIKIKNSDNILKYFTDLENMNVLDYNTVRYHVKDNQLQDILKRITGEKLKYIDDIQIENISMEEIIRNIYR